MAMLPQAEADRLARMAKRLAGVHVLAVPAPGQRQTWQVQSRDGTEDFLLDMNRGSISLLKLTLQERYQATEILLRLDLEGPPHTNPDDTIIPTPHLHIYREGYNDKWAFPIPPDVDISSGNPARILVSFMRYCGIEPVPPVQGGVVP